MQAGQALFPDQEVGLPEDHLITGLLRHSLSDVSIITYETGSASFLWFHFLSQCPLLAGFKTTFFNQIVLDNNSLTDHSTAVILDAISKITDMNQIVIKKNEFHEKSITPLKRILARPFPNQLHELRLVSLRTTAAITTEVC